MDGFYFIWHHSQAKKAVGFEINEDLVSQARKRLQQENCPNTYVITNQDVMEVDLSPFSVVFAWLQPWAMDILASAEEYSFTWNSGNILSMAVDIRAKL